MTWAGPCVQAELALHEGSRPPLLASSSIYLLLMILFLYSDNVVL